MSKLPNRRVKEYHSAKQRGKNYQRNSAKRGVKITNEKDKNQQTTKQGQEITTIKMKRVKANKLLERKAKTTKLPNRGI